MYAKNAQARIDSPHCLKGELGVSNGALSRGTWPKSWNGLESAELEIRYPQKWLTDLGPHITPNLKVHTHHPQKGLL